MEDIIGLLIVIAAMIFKVVGKKLDKAGKPVARKESEVPTSGDFDVKGWIQEVLEEIKEETEQARQPEPEPSAPVAPVVPVAPVAPKPTFVENVTRQTEPAPVSRPVARKKPMLDETVREKSKEKIDPKKLVIYSEIMKPKFTE